MPQFSGLSNPKKSGKKVFGGKDATELLKLITLKVIEQQKESVQILRKVEKRIRKRANLLH